MLGVSQEERRGAVSIVSGSETGIAKRTTFRNKQRLQWRPISAENGKEPTKKWIIRTFYSNGSADNKCPKVSASHQQNTSSNDPSFLAPPVSTELTPLANQSKSSARWVPPKTLQRDESNRCGMSTEPEDMSSTKVSTLANGHRPSVDPPSMSYREPFVQKNQSSGCWKKSDNQNNQPAVAPRKISVYRGEPAIYFDESLINASAEKFKYCLVGKFAHSWPSLAQIRVWASREWKLKGKWSITLLDLNCVFIRLDNEIDMIRIWIRNAWWIKGHLMRVFKWTPEFHLEKGEPSSAAVWITLPFLPLVFFQEDVLFSIASLLGKPLAIDDQIRTLSRTNVARVCIEVDLLVQMPRQVWIGIAGQGFWQPIRYGKLPSYCINCSQQGHSTTVCKFKTSKPETDHPIKKGSCTVVEPSTGFGVASETLTEYKANHHPNNPGSECLSIKNLTKPQVEVCHSNECRSDMNSSVESRPQNSRDHSSVVQVIRSNSVDLKFSSNWLGGGCPHEEYNSFKASSKEFVEDENCQTKQIQNCHPVQDEKKNNQLIIAAPSQQQSVRFKDAGSIPKILTRTEEIEILNVAANCPSNKENCKIVKPEEGNKSVSQNLVHEEPFCRPHFAEIQQTDAKVLQRTHTEINNPEESRDEVDSLVKPPISQILKGQQSTEMIGASSIDARSSKNLARDWHSQDWFLKSNSFVQNYVEGESSWAKNSRKHYAIRNKGSSSQPIIMTSPQLSPKRVTLVEALDKSLENMERIKMGSNNGKQGFGGTFSTHLIMNETFIRTTEKDYHMEPSAQKHHMIQDKGSGSQPIIKTSPHLSPKRVTLVEAMDRKLANRGNIKMGSNKGKQDFGATFSTSLIMNETFIRTTEENDHMKPSGKQAEDKMHTLGTGKAVLDKKFEIQMQEQQKQQQLIKVQGDQNPRTRMRVSSKNPILFWRKKTKNHHTTETYSKSDGSFALKRYKYSDVKAMTMSFRDKIGKGGSGSVFKGVLPDGFAVAVKVLDQKTNGAEEQFQNELASFRKIDHINIIGLLGFCSEGSVRALVYEFMPNGSLDNFIFSTESTGTHSLGWERLYKIAVGIARGLDYMHNWCSPCILHLDIKPSNILLDHDFCPKICDFGLAQVLPTTEETHLTTDVRRAYGDLAPEYLMKCRITHKLDVYSYGVTLLEMVSGRKNHGGSHERNLPDLFYKCLVQGDIGVKGFTGVAEEETPRKMALVGLWCTQWEPNNRPSMKRTLEMLEGNIEELLMPLDPCTNAKDFGGTSKNNNNKDRSSGSGSGFSSIVKDPDGKILLESNLRIFTFAELKIATRNFPTDAIVGEGGFGRVYKGLLDGNTLNSGRSGSSLAIFFEKPLRMLLEGGKESPKKRDKSGNSLVIAVKRLNPESIQGLEEWQAEVNFLGRLSHPNLVKLLGYCWEEKYLLLVYEYMPKGSLENHLFKSGVQPLSWNLRLKIAIGAARGLNFSHTSDIIYRDFKASNILLDSNYNAKLSDFGLAKNGPMGGDSHVTTRVMGTYGYAAPEYVATGHLYVKSDVYGFGVVLLEMLTGLRALDTDRPSGEHNLVESKKPLLSRKKKLRHIMDPRLEEQYPSIAAFEAAQLTLKCLGSDPRSRPSMKEVLETLERIQAIKEKPKESKTRGGRHANLNHNRPSRHGHQR